MFILSEEAFSPDLTLVFNNVTVGNINLGDYVAGAVRAMIEYYGGHVVNELGKCTHLLAVEYNAEAQKAEEANGIEHVKRRVVTPDWIVDCVREGRLVDELPYHPRYLRSDPKNTQMLDEMERKAQEDKVNVEKMSRNHVHTYSSGGKTNFSELKISTLEIFLYYPIIT